MVTVRVLFELFGLTSVNVTPIYLLVDPGDGFTPIDAEDVRLQVTSL